MDRVKTAGQRFQIGLNQLAEQYGEIKEIRGMGLIWGLDVEKAIAEQIVPAALDHGLIVNRTAGTVIRLLPPLTITDEDIDAGLTRLNATFATATERTL